MSSKGKGKLGESETKEEDRKPRHLARLQYLSKGKKLLVEVNPRGQPHGQNAAKFASLLGATEMKLVPATSENWKDISKHFMHQL